MERNVREENIQIAGKALRKIKDHKREEKQGENGKKQLGRERKN